MLAGIFLALKSFLADHERRRKQATIEFTHKIMLLRQPLLRQIEHIFKKDVINVSDSRYANDVDLQWSIRDFLSIMERMATGVNIGVYDLNVYTLITGTATINTYKMLSPVIDYARHSDNNPNLYIQYENLVGNIKLEKERIAKAKRAQKDEEMRHSPSHS